MEVNGNFSTGSDSAEDLSEYTDADESMSAPTEILAEFLYSIMTKDYEAALKYCKMILQYEPNHSTANEFYPLLLDRVADEAKVKEKNGNEPSSESSGSSGSDSSGDEGSNESSSTGSSSDSEGTTASSYSSLEEEETGGQNGGQPLDNAFLQETNGNLRYSDSESPTEPITQQLAAQLSSNISSISLH